MNVSDKIIYESTSFNDLKRLAKDKKPSHAYLLSGNSINPLKAVATSFGQWLHCETSEQTPCGNCTSCHLWKAGTHPAVSIIEPSGNNISISSIREIIKKTNYKTSHNKYQIFIIQEISSISQEAANAFLKTLEEPPDKTLFLLLTTKPTGVMETITSRCIQIKIALPSPQTIIEKYLNNSKWSKGYIYTSLLISGSSLSLIDNLWQTSSLKELEELLSLKSPAIHNLPDLISFASKPVDNLNKSTGKEKPFKNILEESFTSNPSYILQLFSQAIKLPGPLLNNISHNDETDNNAVTQHPFSEAVETALSLNAANQKLSELVTKQFKEEEKEFQEIYGKKDKDTNLGAVVRKRWQRRLTTENILLFIKCIEVAIRIGMHLQSSNELAEYELEKLFPQLLVFKEQTINEREQIKQVLKESKQRVKANVSEKALLIDLCLKLTDKKFSAFI